METDYIYLGYGKTDNTGKAKLEYDANGDPIDHSYTGTGAGEIDIVASTDDPQHISSSSLQDTFSLLDALYYDKMTSATHTDSIWRVANCQIIREAEYTSFKSTSAWGSAYLGTTTTQQALPIDTNTVVIEYDAIDVASSYNFNLRYNDGSNHYLPCPALTGHHKITLTSTRQVFEVDGVVKQDYSVNLPNIYVQTFAEQANMEIKIANFKVYVI